MDSVELPTEPGYYESEVYPLSAGCNPYFLDAWGQWCEYFLSTGEGGDVTPGEMRTLGTLRFLGEDWVDTR